MEQFDHVFKINDLVYLENGAVGSVVLMRFVYNGKEYHVEYRVDLGESNLTWQLEEDIYLAALAKHVNYPEVA